MASKKINKDTIIKNIIAKFKGKEFDTFLAKMKGYDKPFRIEYKGINKGFTPDLIALNGESATIFDFLPKLLKSELQENFQKWILFNDYAQKSGGEFIVLSAPEIQEEVQKMLDAKKINAKIQSVKDFE